MTTLHIEYNDKLVARCILANITWVEFVNQFVSDELTDKEREVIRDDFKRVEGMIQSGEL